jgi:hypothetical protein
MTLSGLLDLGICYVLLFLLLSLIVTAFSEFVCALLQSRPVFLGRTLRRLVDDPLLGARLVSHPILLASSPRADLAPATAPVVNAALFETFRFPAYIRSTDFALATLQNGLELLDKPLSGRRDLYELLARIEQLPPSNFRNVLRALIQDGVTSVDEFRDRIAHWYDEVMERASGLYKRRAHYLALLYGLVLAVIVNADLYSMGVRLWQDGPLRQSIADHTQGMLQSLQPATSEAAPSVKDTGTKIAQDAQLLRPFPIGWPQGQTPLDLLQFTQANLIRLFGYVLTALAVSLGAPFWFDFLQRFVNIRTTGPKPATLKEEQAK